MSTDYVGSTAGTSRRDECEHLCISRSPHCCRSMRICYVFSSAFYKLYSLPNSSVPLNVYSRCIGNSGFPSSISDLPPRAKEAGLIAYDDRLYEVSQTLQHRSVGALTMSQYAPSSVHSPLPHPLTLASLVSPLLTSACAAADRLLPHQGRLQWLHPPDTQRLQRCTQVLHADD